MHIYFNIRKAPSLNKKINKYACIYSKHAQNYTKYAQNGAFTNGTPKAQQFKASRDRYTLKSFIRLYRNLRP